MNIGETIKIHRVEPARVTQPAREQPAPRPRRAPLPSKQPSKAPADPAKIPSKR